MNKILERLKNTKIKPRQAVYPLIITVFIGLTITFFILSAQFLSANLNKALVADTGPVSVGSVQLDLAGYAIVAHKLGIAIEKPAPAPIPLPPPAPTPPPAHPATPPSPQKPSSTSSAAPDVPTSLVELSKMLAASSTKK